MSGFTYLLIIYDMLELLLEITQEDAPCKYQSIIANYLKSQIIHNLAANKIKSKNVKVLYTASKIVLYIGDIIIDNEVQTKKIIGPKTNANQKAIEGFAKKNAVSVDELEISQLQSGESCYSVTKTQSKDYESEIKKSIEGAMQTAPLPKQIKMRGSADIWVRQIINIMCIFDNKKVIHIDFGNMLSSENSCILNEYKEPEFFSMLNQSFEQYLIFLSKKNIILDQNLRIEKIKKQLDDLLKSTKYEICEKRLWAAAGLLDFPLVMICEFDPSYLKSLPSNIIDRILKADYIIPFASNKKTTNYYSIITPTINENIKAQHEQTINTKLKDAQLIWNADLQLGASELTAKAKTAIFYTTLGTISEKWLRMTILSKHISYFIPFADINLVDQLVKFVHIDSMSKIVRFFPEERGSLSACIAYQETKNKKISDIINEYSRSMKSNTISKSPEASCIILAELLDTIVGLVFAEKLTTSRDPMGIKTMIEMFVKHLINADPLNLTITNLIKKSIAYYPDKYLNKSLMMKCTECQLSKKETLFEIKSQILGKFRAIMIKESEINHAVFESFYNANPKLIIYSKKQNEDLPFCYKLLKQLNEFIISKEGVQFLKNHKRAKNIMPNSHITNKIKPSIFTIFTEKIEKELYNKIKYCSKMIHNAFNKSIQNNRPNKEIFTEIVSLSELCCQLIDEVKVNCEDPKIKKKRIELITYYVQTAESIADFGVFYS